MPRKQGSRWFSDEGKHLDRFGLVLGLAAASVTMLSLVDLDDATDSIANELAWMLVTVIVGLTLIVALRASGVARRPRRIAELIVLIAVVGAILVTVAGLFVDIADTTSGLQGRPSPMWALIAVLSPAIVLRRVMMHRVVTRQTIFGVLAVYLLLALAFDYAFLSFDGGSGFFGQPESTSSFMYFSLTTITTVGYGDLTAASDFGRFLASAEAILGQVLLVTVVARLVSTYSRGDQAATLRGNQDAQRTVE
jgi:Ion channel